MRFRFFNQEGVERFQCNLECASCTAQRRNGGQCTRRVCIGLPVCWQHLRTIKDANSGLKIQTSPIPGAGKGVFAWSKHGGNEIVFVPNETICSYDGDIISQAEFDRRYGQDTGPYVAGGQAGLLIDGACKRGAGTIINGRRGHVDSNARFSNSHAGGAHRLTIKATKNIRHGQEIIVAYGADYWRKHRGVAQTTR